MDDLAPHLAREARRLGLDAASLDGADEHTQHTLRRFAQAVLDELAARGLLEGTPEIGCWARPRSSAH